MKFIRVTASCVIQSLDKSKRRYQMCNSNFNTLIKKKKTFLFDFVVSMSPIIRMFKIQFYPHKKTRKTRCFWCRYKVFFGRHFWCVLSKLARNRLFLNTNYGLVRQQFREYFCKLEQICIMHKSAN